MMTTTINQRAEKKVTTAPHLKTATKGQSTSPNRSALFLKSVVVVGSIAATLWGANLATQADQTPVSVVNNMATASTNRTFQRASQPVIAIPNLTTATTLETALNVQLAPIPTVSIPSVVTTSQSSR